MITKRIQILIKEKTEFGEFNDALYFSEEEFAKISEEDVQVKVDERVTNYVAQRQEIKDKPPKEPTEEEQIAYKESLLSEKERIESELQIVDSKLSVTKPK